MDRKVIGNSNLIDQKEIKRGISTIIKNWYWFALFLVLGIGGAMLYLTKSTNYYGASTEILVKPPKDPFKDALSASLPEVPKKEDVANEIMILQSTKLIDETVTKLNLDISYYIKGRLKTGEIYHGVPFSVDGKISDKDLYEVPFELTILNKERFKIDIHTAGYNYTHEGKFGDPIVTGKFSFIISNDSEIIKQNIHVNEIGYVFKVHDHPALVKKYQEALKITQDQAATVFTVSVEDEVPEKAVDFLNMLTNNYIENSISVNKKVNENTLDFIEGQLREVEGQLNSVEGNLEQYQREKTTLNLGQEQSVLFQQSVNFESEKAKLLIQSKSIDMMYDYLTAGNADNLTFSPSILAEQNDPGLTQAFNELFALQQKRTNLLFSNTENSPLVKETDIQISRIKQNILGIVLNVRKTLVNKINGLSTQVGEYQSTIRQMPTTQRGLVNISRNVEIYSKIYEFLLQTRAQTIISKAAIVADKFVLEPAYSTGLIRPLLIKTLLTGFGTALALAFFVIFMKGLFYNYINTKDELKEATSLPIVGIVGKNKEAADYLVVDQYPQSQIAEAFRVIRTNLSYFAPKVSSKVILITSSVAGEGKTFCAVNLATILAKAKKKVVLLDLDLHKPKQANAFNLPNDIGITSYIVGKATTKQIIKDTSVENLQIILSGPRTPNVSEMVLDPMMEQLIRELRLQFEYIIIDSPPVGLLSDALEYMKFSDLNLYVLKAGYSKRDFVDIAHQIVEKNNIKNLSFILNNVNTKNIPAGYGGGYYA